MTPQEEVTVLCAVQMRLARRTMLPHVYEPNPLLTWKRRRTPAQPWLLDVAFRDACKAATPLDADSAVDALFCPYRQLKE